MQRDVIALEHSESLAKIGDVDPEAGTAALARGMIFETPKENCHLGEIRLSDQEVAEDRGSSPIFHTSI